jgi:alcohol dehydrogenase (cytochrome c)
MRRSLELALLLSLVCAPGARGQGSAAPSAPSSPEALGQQIYLQRCAGCHGTKADGGEFAPSIIARVPLRSDDELKALLHNGLASGMPAFPDVVDPARSNLIGYLRTLQPPNGLAATRTSVTLDFSADPKDPGQRILRAFDMARRCGTSRPISLCMPRR